MFGMLHSFDSLLSCFNKSLEFWGQLTHLKGPSGHLQFVAIDNAKIGRSVENFIDSSPIGVYPRGELGRRSSGLLF